MMKYSVIFLIISTLLVIHVQGITLTAGTRALLQSGSNYVGVDPSSSILYNTANANTATTFVFNTISGGWTIQNVATGLFVSAENAGAAALVANRASASSWETFVFTASGSQYYLKAVANGEIVTLQSGGSFIANTAATAAVPTSALITLVSPPATTAPTTTTTKAPVTTTTTKAPTTTISGSTAPASSLQVTIVNNVRPCAARTYNGTISLFLNVPQVILGYGQQYVIPYSQIPQYTGIGIQENGEYCRCCGNESGCINPDNAGMQLWMTTGNCASFTLNDPFYCGKYPPNAKTIVAVSSSGNWPLCTVVLTRLSTAPNCAPNGATC